MEKIKDVYHNKLKVNRLTGASTFKQKEKVYADKQSVKLFGKVK